MDGLPRRLSAFIGDTLLPVLAPRQSFFLHLLYDTFRLFSHGGKLLPVAQGYEPIPAGGARVRGVVVERHYRGEDGAEVVARYRHGVRLKLF